MVLVQPRNPEKSPRRTDTDRNRDAVRGITSDIRYWIGKQAYLDAWTLERCLKWRERNVFTHSRWGKFPQWAITEVYTAFNIYIQQLEDKLAWTHVLDGKRVFSHSPETVDRVHDIYQQNLEWGSCYCHARQLHNGAIMFVPYRDTDREKEVASGRLPVDFQTIAYTTTPLFITHKPNGTPVLAKIVEV